MLVRLNTVLFERGLTQRQLARAIDTTPARVSRIIRGHLNPSPRERAKVSRVLGIPSWRLFPNAGRGLLRRKAHTRDQGKRKN